MSTILNLSQKFKNKTKQKRRRKVHAIKEKVELYHLGPRTNGCCVKEKAISKTVDGIIL